VSGEVNAINSVIRRENEDFCVIKFLTEKAAKRSEAKKNNYLKTIGELQCAESFSRRKFCPALQKLQVGKVLVEISVSGFFFISLKLEFELFLVDLVWLAGAGLVSRHY
jgi:hypothetical protein